MVDDRSGTASPVTLLSGDRTALWIRWIHEGSHSGVLWQSWCLSAASCRRFSLVTGDDDLAAARRLAPPRGAWQPCRKSRRRNEHRTYKRQTFER